MAVKTAERRDYDEYTAELLRQEYIAASTTERIKLLERVGKEFRDYPASLRQLAVTDLSAWVRIWFAKNMYLNDEEKEILRSDIEPVVRAAVLENHNDSRLDLIGIDKFINTFNSLTAMERLAFVRGSMHDDYMEMLLDPHHKQYQFDLTMKERAGLLCAYLDNDYFRHVLMQEESGEIYGPPDMMAEHSIHIRKLWDIIKCWPVDTGDRVTDSHALYAIAKYLKLVHVSEKEKIEVFQTAQDRWLKSALIENALPYEQKIIELGTQDSDSWTRTAAYSKVRRLSPEQIERIMTTKDKDALMGLAKNEELPLETLEELAKVSEDWTWADFHRTMRKRRLPAAARELGDDLALDEDSLFETRHLKDEADERFILLEHKINAVGKRTEKLAQAIDDAKAALKLVVYWGVAFYVVSAVWRWIQN